MTRFTDGPAKGKTLLLARAPLFLRVVIAGGKLDALDQLDDRPQGGERIYAYRRTGPATALHIDFCRGRGRKGPRSAWYRGGDYALVEPQPNEAVLRDTARWRGWATEEAKRLTEGEPKGG